MALDLFRVAGGLQIGDSSQVLEGAAAPTLDAPVGSLYTNTSTGGLYTKIAVGTGANKWELLANKSYVDLELINVNARVDQLGNAFNYVGVVSGGANAGAATNLQLLPATGKNNGDYYKVTVAGYFVDGTSTFYANAGDGLVWNTVGSMDKIDNTDSSVSGTTDFVTVTGSTDTGFVVDVAATFKGRVSSAETSINTLNTEVATLQTDLTAVTSRVTASETNISTLTTGLAAEVTARTNADTNLQTQINSLTSGSTAALDAEILRATTAEGVLTTNLAAEVTARTNADTTLTNNLAAEVTRATGAEGTLTTNLAAEVTRATAAESAEATARAAADTTLTTNLAAEVTRATAAEGALSTRVTTAEGAIVALQADSAEVKVLAATSLTDTVTAPMAKWLVWVQEAATTTNVTAYEIFAASNGVDVDFNRFGILKLGTGVSGASVNVAQSGATMVLSVSTSASANITIKRVSVA